MTKGQPRQLTAVRGGQCAELGAAQGAPVLVQSGQAPAAGPEHPAAVAGALAGQPSRQPATGAYQRVGPVAVRGPRVPEFRTLGTVDQPAGEDQCDRRLVRTLRVQPLCHLAGLSGQPAPVTELLPGSHLDEPGAQLEPVTILASEGDARLGRRGKRTRRIVGGLTRLGQRQQHVGLLHGGEPFLVQKLLQHLHRLGRHSRGQVDPRSRDGDVGPLVADPARRRRHLVEDGERARQVAPIERHVAEDRERIERLLVLSQFLEDSTSVLARSLRVGRHAQRHLDRGERGERAGLPGPVPRTPDAVEGLPHVHQGRALLADQCQRDRAPHQDLGLNLTRDRGRRPVQLPPAGRRASSHQQRQAVRRADVGLAFRVGPAGVLERGAQLSHRLVGVPGVAQHDPPRLVRDRELARIAGAPDDWLGAGPRPLRVRERQLEQVGHGRLTPLRAPCPALR